MCIPISKVAVETPETEQPPPLALPRSIAVDVQAPESRVASEEEEQKSGILGNGVSGTTAVIAVVVAPATPAPATPTLATPTPATPTPATPTPATPTPAAPTPGPLVPRETASPGPAALPHAAGGNSKRGSVEEGSSHPNGRTSKRYSDTSSMASDSMGPGKDTISLHPSVDKVSPTAAHRPGSSHMGGTCLPAKD